MRAERRADLWLSVAKASDEGMVPDDDFPTGIAHAVTRGYDARGINDAVRQARTTDAADSVPPAVARALREAIPTLLPHVGRHRDRLHARDQSRQYVNETLARANQWSPDLGRVPLYYLAALAGELLRYAEQAPRPGAVS